MKAAHHSRETPIYKYINAKRQSLISSLDEGSLLYQLSRVQ